MDEKVYELTVTASYDPTLVFLNALYVERWMAADDASEFLTTELNYPISSAAILQSKFTQLNGAYFNVEGKDITATGHDARVIVKIQPRKVLRRPRR